MLHASSALEVFVNIFCEFEFFLRAFRMWRILLTIVTLYPRYEYYYTYKDEESGDGEKKDGGGEEKEDASDKKEMTGIQKKDSVQGKKGRPRANSHARPLALCRRLAPKYLGK